MVMRGSHGVCVWLLRRASVKADLLLLRGGGGGGVRPNPPTPLWERPCLVCDGAITGWLGGGAQVHASRGGTNA